MQWLNLSSDCVTAVRVFKWQKGTTYLSRILYSTLHRKSKLTVKKEMLLNLL